MKILVFVRERKHSWFIGWVNFRGNVFRNLRRKKIYDKRHGSHTITSKKNCDTFLEVDLKKKLGAICWVYKILSISVFKNLSWKKNWIPLKIPQDFTRFLSKIVTIFLPIFSGIFSQKFPNFFTIYRFLKPKV